MGFPSPFLHRVSVGGSDYFFHSLTLEISDSTVGFPSPEEEARLLQGYRRETGANPGIAMGTLFLTTRCPRECTYCFLQGVSEADMTAEEADLALDAMGSGPADLLLYGGEPLLRQDLVEHIALRVRDSGGEFNLVLATGGWPVDRSIARLLASVNAFIIVSIDGPPDHNDRLRPLRGSAGSFAAAEDSFRTFRDAGCRTGISVTLTSTGIDRARENFLWLMERFRPDDMGLNPWLHPLGRGEVNPCQATVEEAFTAVTGCMEEAISRGMYIEQLARRVRPFVKRRPRLKDCASSGNRLVVMPGGIAGTCDCMTCRGDHGVPLTDLQGVRNLMERFRPLAPVNFPGCLCCPALCICGGGCRYDACRMSGSLCGTWEERCRFERMFLRWMIERTVADGRNSLVPAGGFLREAMPMPVGTMTGEGS